MLSGDIVWCCGNTLWRPSSTPRPPHPFPFPPLSAPVSQDNEATSSPNTTHFFLHSRTWWWEFRSLSTHRRTWFGRMDTGNIKVLVSQSILFIYNRKERVFVSEGSMHSAACEDARQHIPKVLVRHWCWRPVSPSLIPPRRDYITVQGSTILNECGRWVGIVSVLKMVIMWQVWTRQISLRHRIGKHTPISKTRESLHHQVVASMWS